MNLYWWNEIPNVGDSASRYLISRLSSDSIVWKMPHFTILGGTKRMIKKLIREKQLDLSIKGYVFPWEKCIFGIGSILDYSIVRQLFGEVVLEKNIVSLMAEKYYQLGENYLQIN